MLTGHMERVFSTITIRLCFLACSCASIPTNSENYRLSTGGFEYVERAPASSRPKLTESEPFDYHSDSLRRWSQQSEFETESAELMQTLKTAEAENFVQLRIEWEPEFHYLVLFKRAPEETLARYTQNPIFKTIGVPFNEAELNAHQNIIWKRLSDHNAVVSGHVNVLEGRAELHTGLTREEFDVISSLADLHDDPKVKLEFIAPFEPLEEIDPSLASQIRYLSRANRLNGMVQTSLTKGRIVLRDGCFFLDKKEAKIPWYTFTKKLALALIKKATLSS